MEPSSDAPHSQTTPTAQAEPVVQAELVSTLTNAEAFPPKPNDKTKIGSSSNANGSRDLVLDIKAMFESSKHQFSIGESVVSSISSDDFVTMILVDGMFILAHVLISYSNLFEDASTIRIPSWMQQVLKSDLGLPNYMQPILKSNLVLLENQLPFFVLEMLFQQVAESNLSKISRHAQE
nr:hypothetical protein CFP56_51643 [Quercus suber]